MRGYGWGLFFRNSPILCNAVGMSTGIQGQGHLMPFATVECRESLVVGCPQIVNRLEAVVIGCLVSNVPPVALDEVECLGVVRLADSGHEVLIVGQVGQVTLDPLGHAGRVIVQEEEKVAGLVATDEAEDDAEELVPAIGMRGPGHRISARCDERSEGRGFAVLPRRGNPRLDPDSAPNAGEAGVEPELAFLKSEKGEAVGVTTDTIWRRVPFPAGFGDILRSDAYSSIQ